MNRFSETTLSNVAHLAHVFGEEWPTTETANCDSCGLQFPIEEMQPVDDGTDTALICCAMCVAISQEEPECACVQIDVDLADASNCDLHGFSRKPARIERMQGDLFPRTEVA